ncbi:hypothetical protein K4S71_09795 [Staphylococcus epidermidis]|nr:hypothetical protein [Staphylococcus epidermidis]MCG1591655.1 hypothetical protein [Staphylococcus epidermidis]MCG2478646.1 hypothetical protein [Staphylococcus epidermidis]
MLTHKEIKKAVTEQDLNYEEWRKATIDEKMLALISKDKEYYNYWELSVLNESLFKLLINKTSKNKNTTNSSLKPIKTN